MLVVVVVTLLVICRGCGSSGGGIGMYGSQQIVVVTRNT